ncbi:DUF5312 domain-containing protein [Brachyspira hyodysenteriae]|uniref:DUF5312 family protein n=2 Tax=Brachyspira hyodysenteriae TaxID=159 RepID=UPI00063DCCEE|nr:DUF5312 family protein [Brachyspira hyodysenteriae]KLI15229.1 hypothetical protein SU46_10155 [Brachyspira hyodysenteriae]KLI30453.1 hypothetical protein SZ49_06710 [Brachyspira hyodysenteriae]MDA0062663.1 DUF5312 domain-containing protein [Brachyspira hyodysenteriae]MDA0066428.1 DUF5312 domain-containing protein [Brachyspira hyodysenteriae]MDA0071515.1 DUF5312 domain-containing protein [Brachyspira hyodysenteriae]
MNFFDYIKYNLFNIRTPELVEKMRMEEYSDRISKHKYNFVDLKTKALTVTCAKFMFEMYKVIGPLLNPLKEEFIVKDGKQFSYYLIEVSFNNEMKELYSTLNRDYMMSKIKEGKNPNAVFNEVKNNFVKFKKFISGESGKEINLTFNLLKDFAQLSNFDFFLFLRAFCPSFVDGAYNSNPQFKPSSNIQIVDDLVKLDYAVNSIVIRKELLSALNVFQQYLGMPPIPEKNIKSFLARVKYLQTPDIMHDIIVYLLKDFTYKCSINPSNVNIFVNYITDFTNNLKKDMDSIVSEIKSSKIAGMRNKIFNGIEILKMSNVNEEKNEQLEKFDCPIFTCVEPLQYIKTFIIEMFDISYKDPLNDMFLGAEFVSKDRNSQGLDAFYILNDVREAIQRFDTMLSPESENFKRLKTWIISKNKANANKDLIESMVNKIDSEGNKIVLSVYNSVIDLTTIVKNIFEDCKNNTKLEISNANKVQYLAKFNLDIAKKMLDDFDNFIALMKNFVR